MNNILSIRKTLGLSQPAMGALVGVSGGNVSHYETGRQEVPASVARRIIEAAAERGHVLTFDDIYATPAEHAA
ncbi:MAG: helix-turn-helix transcriptional regulator [Candidatus Accumulibacter sp.]|nr:helix-turn-helix transcriptional regulator [Accumulibacter sp.]